MRASRLKIAVASLLFLGLGCATAVTVPAALRPPDTETAAWTVWASGTQNYACAAKEGGQFAWTLVAPDAVLYETKDPASAKVGTHYKGPTWEANDGSKFVGDASQAKKLDSPDPGSIPWLLVPRKIVEGPGAMAPFTFVQRLSTEGGKAPTTGCDAAAIGAELKVPYRAQYSFYKRR